MPLFNSIFLSHMNKHPSTASALIVQALANAAENSTYRFKRVNQKQIRPIASKEIKMKNTLQNKTLKKLIGVVAAGAFAFVPAAGIVSAQADPPRHAPAYGRRDNNNRYDRNNRNRNNRSYNNRNRYQTITGVVTQNYRGSQFNLRMSNGRTIRVDANRHAPRDLNNGDQVRVYGRYTNNVFSASSIAVTRRYRNDHRYNDRYNDRYSNRNNDYRSYAGVITKINSKRQFDIRVDGKTYNVTLSGNAPRGLDRNDYVRVYGKRSGNNDIKNASVSVLRHR